MSALTTFDRPPLAVDPWPRAERPWCAAGVKSLAYDRRIAQRRAAGGSHLASFARPGGPASIARVVLTDVSGAGLGLLSPVAVEVGARVLLYPANGRLPLDCGEVARCQPEGDSFRIGIRRDTRAAA